MKQPFNELIENLKTSIADYRYYVDFDKIDKNVEKYKVELNILNSLIGSKDIENEFISIITKYPETIKVLPILLAVRRNEISFMDKKEIVIKFNNTETKDTYTKFMKETGLFELLQEKRIKSLVDYVTGVEVGLDTNARKNRTGKTMENIVANFIEQVPNITYQKEMKKARIMSEYNIDLNSLILDENPEKDADKRFDFVIKTNGKLYLIETNFYSGGGSKLNETARSFKSLANDINKLKNVEFIWITDGVGWKTAKNNLRETYGIMEHIYTLTDLENGVLNQILK